MPAVRRWLYVDREELLNEAREAVSASAWAAVDTEADSLHHYREKLCLLQVSVPDKDFVIDPFASLTLKRFLDVLSQRKLILHGADFDIRILNRFHDFSPKEIFDTMIAAQLLGYEKQGLADLAERHCGIALPKSNQKADWSMRPLKESMIAYAADDTHYLKTISDKMTEELTALGRFQWHVQTCARAVKSATSARENKIQEGLEWQIKGSKELKPKALTLLKELWHWREAEAQRRDRPSFKVLHSEELIKISEWACQNPGADVALLPHAPRNIKRELREVLNALIRKASSQPPTPHTQKRSAEKPKRLDEASKKRLVLLKAEREKIAKALGVQPSVLATNAILEAWVMESPKGMDEFVGSGRLMPWQAEILSESFLKIASSSGRSES